MPAALRAWLVLLHRWAGLVMAAFRLLAGLTGVPLAWYYELDAAINPHLLRVEPPAPDAQQLDPLLLRQRVLERYPQAEVNFVPLEHGPGTAAIFFISGPEDPASGHHDELDADQVFVDPYTGQVLGGRRWGDISQGWTNFMPFVYRLHYEAGFGEAGALAFGLVALLWTIDCFIGLALTLPPASGGGRWFTRWWPAWKLRGRGAFRINFNLHRAGGLWLGAWLFVFAWSSVAFNLGSVYYPVMHTLLPSQEAPRSQSARPVPAPQPAMGWEAGRAQGRKLMDELARTKGFEVIHEQRLSYRPYAGTFHYRVRSDRDMRDRRGITSIDFDAATGVALRSYIPTGEASGDTITTWLLALHMADVWGQPFKVFVALLSLATCILTGTGVWIWWRKRRARMSAAARWQTV